MKRRSKSPGLDEKSSVPAADADAILQVKVWLSGISPMVWRRVLVPASLTLRELHGVIQVAMGWEGIHLYEFHLRAARYGSFQLSASSPDVTLAGVVSPNCQRRRENASARRSKNAAGTNAGRPPRGPSGVSVCQFASNSAPPFRVQSCPLI